jgi:hypothetical protein
LLANWVFVVSFCCTGDSVVVPLDDVVDVVDVVDDVVPPDFADEFP